MGRPKGNMALAALIDVHNNLGPLDTRQVVKSKSDLIADIWEGYAYKGMLVVVADEGKAYILSNLTNIASSDYSGWTELATSSSAASAASVVQAGDGQASYLEITNTTAQDGHKIYTVSLKPVDVSAATQANTGVADAYQVKTYVDGIAETIEEVTAAALNDLNDKIDAAASDAAVTITESTPSGVAKRYTLSQNGASIGNIDIPKDLVVDEGAVVDIVYEEREGESHYWDGANNIDAALVIDPQETPGYLAGKYIRLTIANSQELPLYIAVKDLVDVYTSGSAATDNIVIAINAQNQITASIGTGSDLAGVVSKVSGIEAGAEVNDISGITLNGSALTPDANKVVDLGNLATAAQLEDAEHVTAAALNDLNDRLIDVDDRLSDVETAVSGSVKSYLSAAITTGSTTTITAATHGCGAFPMVQVYSGNEVVSANISVDVSANSDVTVSWEITPSVSTPIRIRIVG